MGLVTREMILNTEEHIASLPKNSKVEEWLKEPQLVKEESGSSEESTDLYTYLYWTSQEREVLLNVNCRGGQSIRDLFADIMDPVIILAPVLINKEEYLVVLKEYNQNEESESWYSGLTKIKKDTQMR